MAAQQRPQNVLAQDDSRASPVPPSPTVLEMNDRAAELKARLLRDRGHPSHFTSSPETMPRQPSKGPGGADRSGSRPLSRAATPAVNPEQEHNINLLISQYSTPQHSTKASPAQARTSSLPEPVHRRSSSGNPATLLPLKPSGAKADSQTGASQPKDSSLNGRFNDKEPFSGQHQEIPVGPRDGLQSSPKKPLLPAARVYSLQNPRQSPILSIPLAFRPPSRPSGPLALPIAAIPVPSDTRLEKAACGNRANNINPSKPENARTQQETEDESSKDSSMEDITTKETTASSEFSSNAMVIDLPAQQPTLAQLLEHDRDLSDWLTITNYFDIPHREKVLEVRREIMKLDEQRTKLLAELATDDNPVLLAPRNPLSDIPPPSPAPEVKKEYVDAQASASAVSEQQAPAQQDSALVSQEPRSLASAPPLSAPSGPRHGRCRERECRIVSNKRAHSASLELDARHKVQRTGSPRPRSRGRPRPRSRSVPRSRSPHCHRRVGRHNIRSPRRQYRYASRSRGRGRSPPRSPPPIRLRSPEEYGYRRGYDDRYGYDEPPPRRPRSLSTSPERAFDRRGPGPARGRGRPLSPPPLPLYPPRLPALVSIALPRGRRPRPPQSTLRARAADANGLIPFESGGLATTASAPRDLGSRITFSADARR